MMNNYNDFLFSQPEKNCSTALLKNLTVKNGMSFPTDSELLQIILKSLLTEKLADEIFEQVLLAVKTESSETLVKKLKGIKGLAEDAALIIASGVELGKRFSNYKRQRIKQPCDIIPFIKHFSLENRENFVTASLNGAGEILKIRVSSVGIIDRALIHPREIFADPLCDRASAVICCHNHPQGLCKPSTADIESTRALQKAADILGIVFVDHIIITRESYFSFLENGLIPFNSRKKKSACKSTCKSACKSADCIL